MAVEAARFAPVEMAANATDIDGFDI